MQQKLLILTTGVLAGIALVYLVSSQNKPAATPSPHSELVDEAPTPPDHPDSPNLSTVPTPRPLPPVTPPGVPKPNAAPVSAWARLAEKYGTEKAALSSKITSNITSVVTQGMELAQAAARNSGSSNITQAAAKGILRGATRELGLSEDQQRRAADIIEPAVIRRVGAFNDLLYAMNSEPEQIMEMLLAGDALARQQISREEYDRITLPTRTMLQQMSRYIAGGSGGDNSALIDPEISAQMNAILTPEQQARFAELATAITERTAARQAALTRSGMPFQFGEIPVMELERLDQSVASVRQMTEAARSMMDAMKTLKEANPKPAPSL